MPRELPALGILGGTFDPIHFGHLNPVKEAADILGLKQVHFVPASNPPHRSNPLADSHHRLAMVRLAIKDYPEFIADDREFRREGSSYTIDTLKSFREEFGSDMSIIMFVGADAFKEFNTWHQWQHIPDMANIVVLTRPGYPFTDLSVFNSSFKSTGGSPDWLECKDVDQLFCKSRGLVFFQEVTPTEISATEIRSSLFNESERQDDNIFLQALPPAVYDYIIANNLYTSPTMETKCNHRN